MVPIVTRSRGAQLTLPADKLESEIALFVLCCCHVKWMRQSQSWRCAPLQLQCTAVKTQLCTWLQVHDVHLVGCGWPGYISRSSFPPLYVQKKAAQSVNA